MLLWPGSALVRVMSLEVESSTLSTAVESLGPLPGILKILPLPTLLMAMRPLKTISPMSTPTLAGDTSEADVLKDPTLEHLASLQAIK